MRSISLVKSTHGSRSSIRWDVVFSLLMSVYFTASCSIYSPTKTTSTTEGILRADSTHQWSPVTENLSTVLAQLFEASERRFSMSSSSGSNPIYVAMANSLMRNGFSMDRSANDGEGGVLRVEVSDLSTEHEYLARFSVLLNDVEVSREYTIDRVGNWVPSSAVIVSGFHSDVVTDVDDSMLGGRKDASYRLSVIKYAKPSVE